MNGDGPNTFPSVLKVAQLNAENLFLFLDEPSKRDWRKMTEKEWQKLSHASVPNKSLTKTLWLADTLREIDADIVFISEVGGLESLDNYARLFLDEKYTAHLIEGNSDRGIDVGFLVRSGFGYAVELKSHKDRPLDFRYAHEELSATPRTHYFSRDCAELRITKPGDPTPRLICLGVHLKSKLDPDGVDPEGRTRREAELKTLVQIYREIRAKSPSVPVIIGGDFNGAAARAHLAPEFQELASTDLESAADIAGLSGESASTQIQFNRLGHIQHLQIDYIFLSPEAKAALIPNSVQIFRYRSDLNVPLPLPSTLDQRLHLPSDHYPVIAAFSGLL